MFLEADSKLCFHARQRRSRATGDSRRNKPDDRRLVAPPPSHLLSLSQSSAHYNTRSRDNRGVHTGIYPDPMPGGPGLRVLGGEASIGEFPNSAHTHTLRCRVSQKQRDLRLSRRVFAFFRQELPHTQRSEQRLSLHLAIVLIVWIVSKTSRRVRSAAFPGRLPGPAAKHPVIHSNPEKMGAEDRVLPSSINIPRSSRE